jgi:hypothetical protein
MADIIQLRRDVAADWTSVNPTLAIGELGLETDTGKFKVGDGATAWTSLTYYTGSIDLDDLDNVTITANASGEILKWSGSAWINNTLAEAGIQPVPTEGAFVDGDKTKLDGIEAGADVTDSTNVASALATLGYDTDLATMSLPASTTISAFGATLVDDADAGTARTTLGVDAAGTDNSTDVTLAGTPDYITISGQVITRNQVDLTTDITGNLPAANGGTIGQQTIWIPAGAMTARTTNGAVSGSVETTTNKIMLQSFDFDTAADEHVQFAIQMPKGWDEGDIVAQAVWSHPSTTTNFGVVWFIQAVAFADGDAGDTAFGTAVSMTDTGGTTNDIYISPESSAMTVAGSPAAEEYVVFQVYRDVSDANDNLAVDARLHGIKLHYTIDAGNDS